MNSRSEKYENEEKSLSRTQRNKSLYRAMSNEEIENFDVASNTTVLEQTSNNIDVEKLKDMLDKQYQTPQRKSSVENIENLEERKLDLQETRDYDVNKLLSQVHSTKEGNYEIDRYKKLRNTNLDILNGLNVENEQPTSVSKSESKKLKELIDTINLKEAEGYEKIQNETKPKVFEDIVPKLFEETKPYEDPLDLLTELKGEHEETKVLGAKEIKQITKEIPQVEEKEPTIEGPKIPSLEPMKFEITEDVKEEKKELDKTKTQSLTASNIFTQSDFDDFNDLKEEVASTKIVIKLLIFIIIVVLVAGTIFVLNKYLNLGLF